MNSIKCPQCGFVGWAEVEFCKRCGAELQSQAAARRDDQTHRTRGTYQQTGYRTSQNSGLKNGLAIASLVVGIVSFFTFGILGIGALLGITLAIVALVKADRYPAEYGGKGFAIAGLVSSVLSIVIIVPIGIIAAIAIPNLLASRRAANEGSALHAMRDFSSSEASYFSVNGKYGTLDELAAANLIDDQLASGMRNGYRFKITLPVSASRTEQGYEAVAIPTQYPNTGRRSFFINQTGVICGADKHGIEATSLDPPLDLDWSDSESGKNRRASGSYGRAPTPASSY